jgi:hypothetical protein
MRTLQERIRRIKYDRTVRVFVYMYVCVNILPIYLTPYFIVSYWTLKVYGDRTLPVHAQGTVPTSLLFRTTRYHAIDNHLSFPFRFNIISAIGTA